MKVRVTCAGAEMIIQSRGFGTRPKITGELWDAMKVSPIEDWLALYNRPRTEMFPEIDFALGIQNDPLMKVQWLEPIDGYKPTKDYIV